MIFFFHLIKKQQHMVLKINKLIGVENILGCLQNFLKKKKKFFFKGLK